MAQDCVKIKVNEDTTLTFSFVVAGGETYLKLNRDQQFHLQVPSFKGSISMARSTLPEELRTRKTLESFGRRWLTESNFNVFSVDVRLPKRIESQGHGLVHSVWATRVSGLPAATLEAA